MDREGYAVGGDGQRCRSDADCSEPGDGRSAEVCADPRCGRSVAWRPNENRGAGWLLPESGGRLTAEIALSIAAAYGWPDKPREREAIAIPSVALAKFAGSRSRPHRQGEDPRGWRSPGSGNSRSGGCGLVSAIGRHIFLAG